MIDRAEAKRILSDMRERERALFYGAYPNTGRNNTDEAAAGALSELQSWRARIEALLQPIIDAQKTR